MNAQKQAQYLYKCETSYIYSKLEKFPVQMTNMRKDICIKYEVGDTALRPGGNMGLRQMVAAEGRAAGLIAIIASTWQEAHSLQGMKKPKEEEEKEK